jgi:hypothetical protein
LATLTIAQHALPPPPPLSLHLLPHLQLQHHLRLLPPAQVPLQMLWPFLSHYQQ